MNVFQKHRILKALTIFLVVFIAYGLTLKMFVWQDDHAIMFKLAHINEPAGPFGYGIYDRQSSYRGVLPPLYLIYKTFGLNTSAFYFEGIIAYFLASLSVYLLARSLTKHKKISFAASLIFASGFVGAETVWRIFNSVHTSHAIVFTCLTLVAYKKFVDTKKGNRSQRIFFYLAALFLFVYVIETGLVRAHGIIALVVGLEMLWNFKLTASLVRIFPFGFVYYLFYIADNTSRHELKDLVSQIIAGQNFGFLLYPVRNLQNMILPSIWRVPLAFFVLGVIIAFVFLKGKRKVFVYSFIVMFAGYIVYFVHTPTQIFSSIHRYFTLSAVGSSIFIAWIFGNLIAKKGVLYSLVIATVAVHLFLVNRENLDFINTKTVPTRNFYTVLNRETSNLAKGSVFYFDVAEDAKSIGEFGNSFGVGSMPDTTAIAWQHGIDRSDITIARDYKEIFNLVKTGKSNVENIYTFYYESERGLINTTQTTRNALSGNSRVIYVSDGENINLNYSSPLKIGFTAKTDFNEDKVVYSPTALSGLNVYFDYLDSKKVYFESVKVETATFWENLEVSNMVDQKPETFWKGDRLKWHYNHSENVVVTLGRPVVVGAIKMTNKYIDSTPLDYKYFCSLDGKNWQNLGEYYYKPNRESDLVVDRLSFASLCKFVKMDIISTNGDDSPRIAELEVVGSRFKDIDFMKADELDDDPLKYISSQKDLEVAMRFLRRSGMTAKFCYITDKSLNPFCEDFNFTPFSFRNYSIFIPQNGTVLRSAQIYVPKYFKVEMEGLVLDPNYL